MEEILNIKIMEEDKLKNDKAKDNIVLSDVSSSFKNGADEREPYEKEWKELGEDEGDGAYCCGKRMVLKGNVYLCLKCDGWEYSSS